MRNELRLALLLVGAASPLPAQVRAPSGWSDCGRGGRTGVDEAYAIDGGRSLLLFASRPDSLACVSQTLPAGSLRGKLLVLEGWAMIRDPAVSGFWIEVFAPRGIRRVGSMIDDTTWVDSLHLAAYRAQGWNPYVAMLVVPNDADSVRVGASLQGSSWGPTMGWIDALRFAVELPPMATIPSPPPPPPYPQPVRPAVPVPANLSFEQ